MTPPDIPLLGLPCPGIDDEPDTVPPDCAWLDAARAAAAEART